MSKCSSRLDIIQIIRSDLVKLIECEYNMILTFCCLQSPLVQCAKHNLHYSLAYKCFHFPSKTPLLDHQIHFCSQPNRDWNFLVARQNHHDVELPANHIINNQLLLYLWKFCSTWLKWPQLFFLLIVVYGREKY